MLLGVLRIGLDQTSDKFFGFGFVLIAPEVDGRDVQDVVSWVHVVRTRMANAMEMKHHLMSGTCPDLLPSGEEDDVV